jgi:hypothetical protein
MFLGLAAVATMVAAGCGGGSIGEPEGSTNVSGGDTVTGLLLDENSDTVTRGRFVTTDGQISFSATSDADTSAVRIQINGKTFDVTINGSITVDGHDAVLTEAEKALLLTFSEALTSRFQTETKGATRFESVARLGSYLSQAPEGHVHVRLVNGVELPEGVAASAATAAIVCLKKKATATASYTDNKGVRTTKPVVVGSNWGGNACNTGGDYNCMGLCGAGCAGSNWTQDCLDHDTCSHDKCSKYGPLDPNCKDEFNRASDDYNATAPGGGPRCNGL